MFESLVSAIKTKLENTGSFHEVFDYRRSDFSGYPAAVVSPADINDMSFADTARNQRTYIIAIRIYQERLNQGDSNAERILRTIADELITSFDSDPYLSDTLRGRGYVRPIPSTFLNPPDNGPSPDTIGLEILVEAVVIQ